jgi:aspartyl-tRNA(Asn)/glutamyl-tRNA(Gln) amidotransferase subunit B
MKTDAATYEAVIGLEVHAQLATQSKIFCGCSTRFGAPPNTQTCPVCLGLPGVLPVLNREVVRYAIMMGLATHCEIAPYSQFARKNYFYPDLPKGYQISQFDLPLCIKGYVEILIDGQTRRIGLTRIHMEEDAGKNLHEGIDDASHVDLNRTGVPLIEIVSEPDIRTSEEAVAYLRQVRDVLRYLKVCDGNMDEGSFRCDANVSVRPVGETRFGIRAEVKNMNSFRYVQKALEYEIARQIQVLGEGGRIVQETRLWDAARGVTVSMRSKEGAHDYRYFPEPDLVPLEVSLEWIDEIRRQLPELPEAKKKRFAEQYGIPEYDAAILTVSRALADFFESSVAEYSGAKAVSNWIMGDLLRELKQDGKEVEECLLRPEELARMLRLIDEGVISGKIAKTVFEEMYRTGKGADEVISEKGLVQVTDEPAIRTMILEAMKDNPKELAAYRSGKDKLLGFFVGQIMKVSAGKASPAVVNDLLKKMLAGE